MATETYSLGTTVNKDDKSNIESQYEKLSINRETYIERAREASELTIPHLFPPKGANEATTYPTPYQSVGSRGVTNLASKLMLALFPPQAPFFRLDIDDLIYKQLEGNPQQKATIEQGLAKIEKSIMDNIETNNDRVAVYEALKQLIISGNVLLKLGEEGLRVIRLENYVVKRDPEGKILTIIIKEHISRASIPPKLQNQIPQDMEDKQFLHLYTHVTRQKNGYKLVQEINKTKVLSQSYTLENMPFIPLRFNRVDGSDYGRGHVESYIGDLKSLEGLTRSILEGSSASSKMLFMVAPNGTTRASSIAKAPNGAIIEGSAGDVSVLQANKFGDFRVALEASQRIEQRLQFAFLLNASVQRQAERVTATEVQLVANELQDALGGVYGILTTEFQLPYLRAKIALLRKQKLLPELPENIVKTKIIVGMEALGRASDRIKLLQFMSDLASTLGAETLAKYVNLDDAIKKFAIANGIDTQGLIKSPEQVQQEMQQQQALQAGQQFLDPRVITKAGDLLNDNNQALEVNEQGEPNIVDRE